MDYITVGKLNKTFGTKGQIRVVADKAFKKDLENAEVWFVENTQGIIPYFVESLEDSVHFLVKFEDVKGPEDARLITGGTLKLRKKDVSYSEAKEESDLEKLIGFEIINAKNQSIGVVKQIEEFPQQLMAIVIDSNKSQFMIPLAADFILDINPVKSVITMQLPDGLIESQL